MDLAAAGSGAGGGTILLIGVLAVGGQIIRESAAGIALILVLHATLIRYNRVTGRIEGHAVQKGIEGRGAIGCNRSCNQSNKTE